MKAKEPERFGKNESDGDKTGESVNAPDVAAVDGTESVAAADTESTAATETVES